MVQKVLALTKDGRMTYCSVPSEKRGIGRCNHTAHHDENDGMSDDEFVQLASENPLKLQVLERRINQFTDEDIKNLYMDAMKGRFRVGTNDGADIKDVQITTLPGGLYKQVTCKMEYHGKIYDMPFGKIPIQKEGYIHLGDPDHPETDHNEFRVQPIVMLPSAEIYKASYINKETKEQEEHYFASASTAFPRQSKAFSVDEEGNIKLIGYQGTISPELAAKLMQGKDPSDYWTNSELMQSLTPKERAEANKIPIALRQKFGRIDPMVYERFGIDKDGNPLQFNEETEEYNIDDIDYTKTLKNMQAQAIQAKETDTVDDKTSLKYRRIATYSDQIEYALNRNIDGAEKTFTNSLGRERKLKGDDHKDEWVPTLSNSKVDNNILQVLRSRSNVQPRNTTNKIAELAQLQQVSWTGPLGLDPSKDKTAKGRIKFTAADSDLNPTYAGLVDPDVVSQNANIGKVMIASNMDIDKYHRIKRLNKCKDPEKDEYYDPGNTAISKLIPFSKNQDNQRLTLATSQAKQALPLVGGEEPEIVTTEYKKLGHTGIGRNLNIAYLPSSGVFEDSSIISQSAAKKLTSIEISRYSDKDITNPDGTKMFKPGDHVNRGQLIGNGKRIVSSGIVQDDYTVKTIRQAEPGDKLTHWGNKSTINSIVPDDQMPILENGERAEMLMSPMSIPKRMSMNQIAEVSTPRSPGQQIVVGDTADLTKLKTVHKVTLPPHSRFNEGDKPIEVKETSGRGYIMKLDHLAENAMRGNDNETDSMGQMKSRFGVQESFVNNPDVAKQGLLQLIRQQGTNGHPASRSEFRSFMRAFGMDIQEVPKD